VLASSSPRRRQLLGEWGYIFDIIPADVSEELPADILPQEGVKELAGRKARYSFELWKETKGTNNDIILGADTIVVSDGKILGKPDNEEQAARMLASLSGRSHQVMTGIALASQNDSGGCVVETEIEISTVAFKKINEQEIQNYIQTGESMDKAGAYGIQGEASKFANLVEGSLTNVIGLPMELLKKKLGLSGVFPQ